MARSTSRTARIRHLRHRKMKGLERGAARTRLPATDGFIDGVVTALSGTAATDTFTANATTNRLTVTAHGFAEGDGPFEVSSDDTLPDGLSATTQYFVSVVDANTLELYTNPSLTGSAVDIADTGTGTHSIARSESAAGMIELLRSGVRPETLAALTDIDDA